MEAILQSDFVAIIDVLTYHHTNKSQNNKKDDLFFIKNNPVTDPTNIQSILSLILCMFVQV